jgi:mediator of RNA polymerase II transcription subunit 13
MEVEENEEQPPALVIYIIDPFTYGCQEPEQFRLASLALLRCFNQIQKALPESKHEMCENMYLQVLPLETVVSVVENSVAAGREEDGGWPTLSPSWVRPASAAPSLKSLAFSVFTQCRTILNHSQTAKSLTGFGPAASADTYLKNLAKEVQRNFPASTIFPKMLS